jgi:protein-tyrosine phosphatase
MRQVPGSYWVRSGRFLAGAYPGESLNRFVDAGVTTFVDLTEAGELAPYELHLPAGVRAIRKAIRDFECPSIGEMERILDVIDDELDSGAVVYLHCRGGLGRTGTVVGCWLVRHGTPPAEALDWIAATRGAGGSPETDDQRNFVLRWREGVR